MITTNVPILALSQVSRGVEGRNNKRPMMSDLSQSGILEMVADNIIFAYREEYHDPNTEKLVVENSYFCLTGKEKDALHHRKSISQSKFNIRALLSIQDGDL